MSQIILEESDCLWCFGFNAIYPMSSYIYSPILAHFPGRYLEVGKIPGRYRELIKKNREDTELIKKKQGGYFLVLDN